MTDDDPKPGVVIDVTPEQEGTGRAHAGQTVSDAPDARRPAGGVLAMTVAVAALLVTAVGAYLGFNEVRSLAGQLAAARQQVEGVESRHGEMWQAVERAAAGVDEQRNQLAMQREVLARQQLAADEARVAFERQAQVLADERVRMQEREGELRAAVVDVHQRVGRSGNQWMIAETEYLMQVAAHRLELERDIGTARAALQLADQRLRDTLDPGWAGVREQIAREIAALNAFQGADFSGLSARLAALGEQVSTLKPARVTVGVGPELPAERTDKPGERSWDTLFSDLWAGFKDTVRIRERDQPVQAMLAPEHEFFLYENLKLHLAAARLGLARADQALFSENLASAAEWVRNYFDLGEGGAATLLSALDELRTIDVRPPLPDISKSLRALRARRQLMVGMAPEPAASP
ncbi:MAG: uroporphyrinogen-III C-methyltransferase [Gammaproteobacteria bacterium]|nr:uroporphyrinogen-III C-methyltransferase [Gammaproteobacteria bacterium]